MALTPIGYPYYLYPPNYPFKDILIGELMSTQQTVEADMTSIGASASYDYYPEQTEMIKTICKEQVELIREKDNSYKGAWKKRGGTGAFHQGIDRCWSRLETLLEPYNWDIFKAIIVEREQAYRSTPPNQDIDFYKDGTISATIRDLRSYLLLVEAHIRLLEQKQTAPSDYLKFCNDCFTQHPPEKCPRNPRAVLTDSDVEEMYRDPNPYMVCENKRVHSPSPPITSDNPESPP